MYLHVRFADLYGRKKLFSDPLVGKSWKPHQLPKHDMQRFEVEAESIQLLVESNHAGSEIPVESSSCVIIVSACSVLYFTPDYALKKMEGWARNVVSLSAHFIPLYMSRAQESRFKLICK